MEELEPHQDWIDEQNRLKENLILTNQLDFDMSEEEPKGLRYIGGADISFVKDNQEDACSSLVILSYPDLNVVYQSMELVKLDLPYISGFLAFREVPHLVKQVETLRKTRPEILPQIIFCDGNGRLHPRGFGLACHLGVLCDIPTIGIGKSFLQLDGLTVSTVKALNKTLQHGGDWTPLKGDSGTIWGAMLRTTEKAPNAIYVSIGNRCSLESAIKLTQRCSRFRIPEPVRQADLLSREFIRQHFH